MAKKTTGKKYNNYGYVLLGKPGKRRWRKRDQVSTTKKAIAGVDFVNTVSALANRNRREKKLLEKALMTPATEENRRQRRRAFIRAGVYTAAVALTTGVITTAVFKNHRQNNIRIANEAAEEISRLARRRYEEMARIVGTSSLYKSRDGLTDAAEEILDDFASYGRTRGVEKDNIISKMIAAVRGDPTYSVDPSPFAKSKKGIKPMGERIRLSPQERMKLLDIKDKLDALDDTLLENISNLERRFLKRGKLSKTGEEALDYLDRLKRHVKATNIDGIASDPAGAKRRMAAETQDSWLESLMDEDLLDKMKGSKIADIAGIDDVFDSYMSEVLSSADSVYRRGPVASGSTIFANTKGFRDDFMTGLQRRRNLASYILREGDVPETISGGYKPKRMSEKEITDKKKGKLMRDIITASGYRGPKDTVVGALPGVDGTYRPHIFGDNRLTAREKARRIMLAAKKTLAPKGYTDEGTEAMATLLDAAYKGTAAAHTGAFIGHTLSKGIIDSLERNEDIEDGIRHENLMLANLKGSLEAREKRKARDSQMMRNVRISSTKRR